MMFADIATEEKQRVLAELGEVKRLFASRGWFAGTSGNLSIRAERSAPTDEGVQWVASERFAGRYMRQLSLGSDV